MTVRQPKVPGAQADVLLADLQHCRWVPPAGPPGRRLLPALPNLSVLEIDDQGMWWWPQLQPSPLGQHLAWSPPTGVTHLTTGKWAPSSVGLGEEWVLGGCHGQWCWPHHCQAV